MLGIETSSPVTSVALWDDDAPVAREVSEGPRDHVEFLMPAVMRLAQPRTLDAIAVGIGPGLFTSMRVGIATAKTLAAMLEVPIVGVCSLDALAYPLRFEQGPVVACVDAYRREVYAARYEGGTRIDGPRALAPAALAAELTGDVLIVGNGPEVYPDELATFSRHAGTPDADPIVALALPRLRAGDYDDATSLEPMYVRRSDAEIKWDTHGVTIERPMRVTFPGA